MTSVLKSLFGRGKTPAEMLREHQRTLDRAMRDLEKERRKMDAQEKKIIIDIKKSAKQGQMAAVRIMAKDMVRTRRYASKFATMRSQLQGVSLRLQTLGSTDKMATAMRGAAMAMRVMNRQMNVPALQRIMMEFEKQSQILEMKEDFMGEVLDSALDEDDDEKETDMVVNQILDEIGISINQAASGTPSTRPVEAVAEVDPVDTEEQRLLDERFQKLRDFRGT